MGGGYGISPKHKDVSPRKEENIFDHVRERDRTPPKPVISSALNDK